MSSKLSKWILVVFTEGVALIAPPMDLPLDERA